MCNSSSHLLDISWSKRFGRGLIDCHYDSATSTISVCDLSGLSVISDSSGQEIERTVFDMPAWGIAHRFSQQRFVIACALADKANTRGAIVLRCDSVDLFRIDYDTECWDVQLTEGFLYWTMWDGRCGRLRLSDLEAGAEYVNLSAGAYGLSTHGEKVFATARGVGIYQIDDGLSFTPELILQNHSICYNSVYSESFSGHYAGSFGNSPVVQGTEFTSRPTINGDICGIAVFGDFLFVGSLAGELALLAPNVTSRVLGTLEFQKGIWNLSIAHDVNALYVACGDGSLYCITIKESASLRVDAQTIDVAFGNIKESYDGLFDLTSAFMISLMSMRLEEHWGTLSDDELKMAGQLLQQWTHHLSDYRINYLLGLYFSHSNQFDDAVVAFQKIDPDHEYFIKALMPLSVAFEGIGALSSAVRVLQANLKSIPKQQIGAFLFRIGEIHERCGDRERALQAFEALSFLQHSYCGVQEALQRLAPVNQSSFVKSTRGRRITFEQVMEFDKLNKEIYIDLCKQYKNRNLVPFIGAGMSVIAGFPLWEQFLKDGYKVYNEFLGGTTEPPSNLLKAASKLYNSLGSSIFNRYFEKTFGGDYTEDDWQRIINQAQTEANGLFQKLFRDAVITTNFDRFLERLYPAGTIISHPNRPAQLNRAIQDKKPIIVKLHGCVSEPEAIVFTKKSYDSAYPKTGETEFTIALEKFLTNKTLLFLGCSLGNDATINHLRKLAAGSKGIGIDHFAIVGCKPEEKISRRKDLSRTNILAITYDCDDGSNHDAVRAILQQLQMDTK